MKHIPILVLAAGASTRMRGQDKMLELVRGDIPLLAERLATGMQTGQRVFVALPPREQAPKRWEIGDVSGVDCVEITQPERGLSSSLKGLIAALPPDVDGAMVLPADMPEITSADIQAVLQAFNPEKIIRGAADGKPGHPVLFPQKWFPGLMQLSGDIGAREVLKTTAAILVPLPGMHALQDLDTPEDWEKWRKSRA